MRIGSMQRCRLALGVSAVSLLAHASSLTAGEASPAPGTHAAAVLPSVASAKGDLPGSGAATVDSAAAMLAGLPADFVENRCQWQSPARFVAWKGNLVASLERSAIRLRVASERAAERERFGDRERAARHRQ